MRSKWARIVSMTLVGTMLLTGCGGASGDKKEDSKDEKKEVSDNLNKEGLPILKEKETFTIAVPQKSTLKSAAEKECVKAAEEATNVHIEWVEIPASGWKEKINIMFNTDSLPDAIIGAVDMAKNYEQLAELDDMLKEYAPNTTAFFETRDDYPTGLYSPDGKIHTLPTGDEAIHNIIDSQLWINQKWLDNLGLQMPTTVDEFKEVLIAFRDKDPNGNGKADEIPMTGFVGGWSTDPTVWLTNAFIQCNKPLSNTNPTPGAGLVVSEDGKIEYQVMKEEYRDALAYMNKLYSEGLLDSQTFTQDETQFTASLDSEENIVALYAGGGVNVDGKNFWANKPGKWQDWTILEPVEGPDGVRLAAKSLTDYFGSCLGVVSASCKNPEIAVALFDFLASEEGTLVQSFGPQGLAWDYVDEGTALDGGTAKYANYKIDEDYDWVGNGYKKAYGDHSYWLSDAMIGSRTVDYRNGQLIENPELNTEYTFQAAAQKYEPYSPKDESIVPNLVFDGQDAQTISESTITIGGYVDQSMVQFITGELNIEKDWDAYIEQLKTMGVDNFLEIYQKYYDEYMEAQK